MKTSHLLIPAVGLLAIGAASFLGGCSKKTETPPPAETTPPPAPPQSTTSAPAANPAATAADLVKSTSEKVQSDASAMAADVKAKAESATATAAAEAKKKAEATAATTPAPTVPANVADATAAAGVSVDSLKQQAEQLLSEYSTQLTTLKDGAAKVKALIDQNAAMLPAGVQAKYQELNTLMPRLTAMVDSLKNYQTADLTALVPKLKADFSAAQKLYGEIKALVPTM